jgi:uncharacterized membrane protein YuzA (DUF378 family)
MVGRSDGSRSSLKDLVADGFGFKEACIASSTYPYIGFSSVQILSTAVRFFARF